LVSVSQARHSFSGCPCGHNEHVGATDWQDRNGWRVVCPECKALEKRENVIIATDTVMRCELLSIVEGATVRCNGQTCRVVGIAEVVKLNGRYRTGYMLIKLREAA
jgi:hypothetical protein